VQQFGLVNAPRPVRWLAVTCLAALPIHAAAPVSVKITTDTSGASSRAVLTFSAPADCHVREGAGTIQVLCAQPIAPGTSTQTLDDPILAGFAFDGDRGITFTTGRGYRRLETFELKNPARIVLDLQGERGGAPAKTASASSRALPVIVVDPGHGGVEVGAVGKSGLQEKDVTLDLARRLVALLAKQGVTAVLTRDEDKVMPLDDRTAIANQNRAELFVSIHLNASKRKVAVGAETYYLSTDATDAEARTLAALENKAYQSPAAAAEGATAGEGAPAGEGATAPASVPDHGLELVLWDLAQNSYLAESSRLADSIQKELNALTGVRDRGVRQAPFRVLMGATMPAILVEVGFISNPDEETRFKDDAYKDKIAEGIARAVTTFRRDSAALDGRGHAGAGGP